MVRTASATLFLVLGAYGGGEDWRLVTVGSDYAYGVDAESVVAAGSLRAFSAVSVERDGYGKATLLANCVAKTIRMADGSPAEALVGATGSPESGDPPVGAEVRMVDLVCAENGAGFPRDRPTTDFDGFLKQAGELMGSPPPVPCGPPPFSRYARTAEECR